MPADDSPTHGRQTMSKKSALVDELAHLHALREALQDWEDFCSKKDSSKLTLRLGRVRALLAAITEHGPIVLRVLTQPHVREAFPRWWYFYQMFHWWSKHPIEADDLEDSDLWERANRDWGEMRLPVDLAIDVVTENVRTVEPAKVDRHVERLIWDDLTQTVTLDGQDYLIDDLKAYRIYRAIATAEQAPITKADIQQQVKGVMGRKAIHTRVQSLPPALRKTIQVNTTGYWLKLPPIRERKRAN
jgi:hypothetical protein